jgi:hypothetical protein
MRAGVDLGGTKIDVLIVEGERDVRGRARRADTDRGRRRRGRRGDGSLRRATRLASRVETGG